MAGMMDTLEIVTAYADGASVVAETWSGHRLVSILDLDATGAEMLARRVERDGYILRGEWDAIDQIPARMAA